MLIALLITAVLGCIVRGHHMFMVGFDLDTRPYLTFATPIIAIPTGIKILNRLATIRSTCFSLITPLYFIIGFPFSSIFGGFTGLISANNIIDIILHDPYFVIGHLHQLYSFIRLIVSSFDVIHTIAFYSLGIKIDAIPGKINSTTTLRLLNKGEYRGKCFELCGQGHLLMMCSSIVYWFYYY
jgi:heme/copper-type cytochrome/quinol oxidase subunit 1